MMTKNEGALIEIIDTLLDNIQNKGICDHGYPYGDCDICLDEDGILTDYYTLKEKIREVTFD